MVDLTPETDPQSEFSLGNLNPFQQEQGMNDPNRVTLMDTFGQEGLGSGLKQLTQMVTPQSMWGQSSSASLMNDFVEFSPIGDVRDFISGVNPNSGLDPLERGLAVFSALPMVGSGVAVSFKMQQALRLRQLQTQVHAQSALEGFASTGGEAATLRYAMYYDVAHGEGFDGSLADADPRQMTDAEQASFKQQFEMNREKRKQLEGGKQYVATSNVYELAEVFLEGDTDPLRVESVGNMFNELGIGLRQELPHIFDQGSQVAEETQNLEAAKFALMTYEQLADGGLLRETRGEGGDLVDFDRPVGDPEYALMTVDGMKSNIAGYKANEELYRIHAVVTALANVNIGPDLKATPQFELGGVVIPSKTGTNNGPKSMSNVGATGARVILFGNDLAPDQRIMNADGVIIDRSALEERQRKVDYQTLSGDMAANVMRFLRMGEDSMTPAEMRRGADWYRRANSTARVISHYSGIPLRNVAALMSALSPRSKWAPDNLGASIHAALRFGNQDLDPASPQYKKAFVEAIKAGGWEHDLFAESSKPLQKQFEGDLDGLVEYYADIQNFVTANGQNLRGMALGSHKDAAAMAAIAQMPPDLVLRMAKTNNFYAAILDPANPDVMAVDVWHDSLVQGFKSPVEPLGSSSQRAITATEVAEGTYRFPSGNTYNEALVAEGEAALRDAGLTEAEIAEAMERARKVSIPEDDVRYQAIVDATKAAGALMGNEVGSSIQATVWNPARDAWFSTMKQLQALKRAGVDAESQIVKQLQQKLVVDRSIMHHYEGNPQFQKNVVALTQNVSDDLSIEVPIEVLEGRSPRPWKRDSTGTPYIITQRGDGTTEVWADTTNGTAMRTLRHLEPAPQKVGDWTRMVPKKPRTVTSVQDVLYDLDPDGAAQSRVLPLGSEYVGNVPGNFFVFETADLASAKELQTLLDGIEGGPYEIALQQTGVQRSRVPAPVSDFGSFDVDAVHNPETSPLLANDWVIISAEVNPELADQYMAPEVAHEALREDLIEAAMTQFGVSRSEAKAMVIEVDGVYKGLSEKSLMVFGLNYDMAFKLGEKYGQEAVATRNGMIYTTGEDAGAYHPADDSETHIGKQVNQGDYVSRVMLDEGYAEFSAGYEWGNTRLPAGSLNSLMGQHVRPEPRHQVIVALDGAEGHAAWPDTQALWDAAQQKAVSSTAYTNGDLHRPNGTQPIHEHLYHDGATTGVRRTRLSDNPSAVRAYVPRHEHAQVGEAVGREGRAKLTKREASATVASAVPSLQFSSTVEVGDVIIDGINAELEIKDVRKGVLEWEFSYNGESLPTDGFTVDFSGSKPIITHTEGPRSPAPGLVYGKVRNGEAVLEAADPNDFVAAAVALESLGYKTKKSKLVQFAPMSEVGMPNEGIVGQARTSPSGSLDVSLFPLPEDFQRTESVKAKYGGETNFVWSTSSNVSEAARNRFFETLEALLDPDSELMPGITLEPHVLGDQAIPNGIGMVQGYQAHMHGATDLGSRISDRVVTVNERMFLAEDEFGPDVVRRTDRLRDPNHFADTPVTFSQHVLTHEVGHAVLSWLSHHLPEGGDVSQGKLESHIGGLRRQLTPFGVARNLGGYAAGDAHEFFSEAFVAVATGQKVDPRIERMVREVVEYANGLTPRSGRLESIPGPWTS